MTPQYVLSLRSGQLSGHSGQTAQPSDLHKRVLSDPEAPLLLALLRPAEAADARSEPLRGRSHTLKLCLTLC